MKIEKNALIYVAGHSGLAGSALVRKLRAAGHTNLLLKSHAELDLLDQAAVHRFFKDNPIQYTIIAAARVGGIHANKAFIADFLWENLMIAANTIHAALETKVEKLLFLGSSCIYPKLAPQPIHEEALLTGLLEPSNEGYAIAKIAALKYCEMIQKQYGRRFISAMPTNLYGPNDNFHPERSHVIPGMMRRFHEAKIQHAPEVAIWGSGTPKREFMHVDDLAEAIYLLLEQYEAPQTINVGTGTDQTIQELAQIMKDVTGYAGKIVNDLSRPDGTPQKVLDVSKLRAMNWQPKYELKMGLKATYRWATENKVL